MTSFSTTCFTLLLQCLMLQLYGTALETGVPGSGKKSTWARTMAPKSLNRTRSACPYGSCASHLKCTELLFSVSVCCFCDYSPVCAFAKVSRMRFWDLFFNVVALMM